MSLGPDGLDLLAARDFLEGVGGREPDDLHVGQPAVDLPVARAERADPTHDPPVGPQRGVGFVVGEAEVLVELAPAGRVVGQVGLQALFAASQVVPEPPRRVPVAEVVDGGPGVPFERHARRPQEALQVLSGP